MIKAVFDTNIYISAILFGGKPQSLITSALKRQFYLFISPEILSEIYHVLTEKFQYPPIQAKQTVVTIRSICHLVHPTATINTIKDCPADNRILECCQQSHADYLVSGDKKHLLALRKFGTAKIITPTEFAKALSK